MTWMWREPCAPGNAAEPDEISGYLHYHLSFAPASNYQNPATQNLWCGTVNYGDGYGNGWQKLVNGSCITPNYTAEARNMSPHDPAEWIRIFVRKTDHSVPQKVFDLQYIRFSGTPHVQLWFRKVSDGSWWGFPDLAPQQYGNATGNPWIGDIDEIHIRGVSDSSGTWSLEELKILD